MQHFRLCVRLVHRLNKKLSLLCARGLAVVLGAVLTSRIPCQWLRGSLIKLGLPQAAEILTAI